MIILILILILLLLFRSTPCTGPAHPSYPPFTPPHPHTAFGFTISQCAIASFAQWVEHVLRKRMVVGSIPTGGRNRVGDGYLAAPSPHLARARAAQYRSLSFFKAVMKQALHMHTESPQ